ncbi:MAG: sigma-54 dependent transcriptional regulator [Holophagales bacterium]|jgi:two-component system nitrogen regulation response regulator NtrX|nr:sigma-54 dependent transcriptional regulator [Holophagales bacterium]
MKPACTILVVDDEPGIRRSLGESLVDEGFAVLKAESGERALELLEHADSDDVSLMLLDVGLPGIDGLEVLGRCKAKLPNMPVVMISGHGNINTALRATKLGAFDFIEKPIDLDRLLLVIGNALRQRTLEAENIRLQEAIAGDHFFMAESQAMKALLADIALVAPTDGRVLLTGENGAGKEEVAKLIHAQSKRRGAAFIEVNCAAIPEELIESELFGHTKGAFTGAIRDQKGKFREADGGTLFLDEVGDMSLKTQAKVLRTLQEGRVEPIGGGRAIDADARVIAATNKDLTEEIKAGRFREDLYFRLAVVLLKVPPLRERREEIILLAEGFLSRIAKRYRKPIKKLSEEAKQVLLDHDWPGNVRELKNMMERALIMGRGVDISAKDLGPLVTHPLLESGWPVFPEFSSLREAKEWFEKLYIQRELSNQMGSVAKAAAKLGLDRSSLYKRLRAIGMGEEPVVPDQRRGPFAEH